MFATRRISEEIAKTHTKISVTVIDYNCFYGYNFRELKMPHTKDHPLLLLTTQLLFTNHFLLSFSYSFHVWGIFFLVASANLHVI